MHKQEFVITTFNTKDDIVSGITQSISKKTEDIAKRVALEMRIQTWIIDFRSSILEAPSRKCFYYDTNYLQ